MTRKIRSTERQLFEIASTQIGSMAKLVHQVDPGTVVAARVSPKEALAILTDIKAIQGWFDALLSTQPRSRGRLK
jgi:hypothetical protein